MNHPDPRLRESSSRALGTRRRHRRLPAATAALAAALSVGLAACGTSGGSATTSSTTSKLSTSTSTSTSVTRPPAQTSTTVVESTTTTTTTTVEPTTTATTTTTTVEPTTTATTTVPQPGPTTTTVGPRPAADAQAYLDAFAADIVSEQGAKIFERSQADCMARRFLDTIGLERLRTAGVAPKDFKIGRDLGRSLGIGEDEANRLYDLIPACGVDLKGALLRSLTAGGPALTPSEQACFDRAFRPEDLRQSLVSELTGKDVPDTIFNDIEKCFADRLHPKGNP